MTQKPRLRGDNGRGEGGQRSKTKKGTNKKKPGPNLPLTGALLPWKEKRDGKENPAGQADLDDRKRGEKFQRGHAGCSTEEETVQTQEKFGGGGPAFRSRQTHEIFGTALGKLWRILGAAEQLTRDDGLRGGDEEGRNELERCSDFR